MSPTNIAASVKARLQNKARESNKPFNDLLRLYAMERFLYRLSKSEHAEKFVLKGALLFMVWKPDYERRTTMDIDLLGFTENSLDNLATITKAICEIDVEEDGMRFDSENIRVGRIKEDADYEGVRILTNAFLERSRIPIQIDIGFGDALVPDAIPATIPTLLDFPVPELRCYHQLTAIAVSFSASVMPATFSTSALSFLTTSSGFNDFISSPRSNTACGRSKRSSMPPVSSFGIEDSSAWRNSSRLGRK